MSGHSHTYGTESNLARFVNTCPACGKPVIYSNVSDRTYHLFGESNRACWGAMASLTFDLHATAQRGGGR